MPEQRARRAERLDRAHDVELAVRAREHDHADGRAHGVASAVASCTTSIGVALDHGVGEQPVAHVVDLRAGVGFGVGVEREADRLRDRHRGHVVVPERGERPFDRRARGVEHPGQVGDVDPHRVAHAHSSLANQVSKLSPVIASYAST